MDVIYLPISENFTAEDQALMSFVSRRRALTFYTIWTRKEAYLKYLGTGLSGDITKIDVCDPAISGRFISKCMGTHMCSVFNGAGEPVDFTTIDIPAVRRFFLG